MIDASSFWTRDLPARAVLGVTRSRTDRVVAGVAGGVGDRLRVDPVLVRLAFVALTAAGGFGVGLYLAAWFALPEQDPNHTPPARVASNLQRAAGFGLLVLAMLVFLRDLGLWFADSLSWPVALAAFGSAVIWTRSDTRERADPVRTVLTGRGSMARVAAGGLLVISGMGSFLLANNALADVRNGLVAIVVAVSGLGLILAPWIWRLARQVSEERRERICSEERAEVAAHLHDSVLQTLALIQRARDPGEMVSLARGQERELRTWLYGRTGQGGVGSLSIAVNEMAGRMEQRYHIPVDVVVVGDRSLDAHAWAVIEACGEAVQNAAQHSGADLVSVYVEASPDALTVYVRDEGKGFDVNAVPDDRRGINESILGRIQRHGGRATLMSEPGEGTEVELWMPLERR
jgi:signal transduction histidine kinase/phage shock protein PspC (stress-responsive transcriptional regulator)